MKWSIWIEPNKIIEEEYPNGWSHDEVFEAASARWANKVTTVNPAPVGGSSNSSSQSNNNSSSSSSSLSLSDMFTLTMVGAVVIGVASLFPSNNNKVAPVDNNEKMEYQQPSNNVIQYSEHHIDESIPEFFNTEFQEEPINDLGQDWDN